MARAFALVTGCVVATAGPGDSPPPKPSMDRARHPRRRSRQALAIEITWALEHADGRVEPLTEPPMIDLHPAVTDALGRMLVDAHIREAG